MFDLIFYLQFEIWYTDLSNRPFYLAYYGSYPLVRSYMQQYNKMNNYRPSKPKRYIQLSTSW